MPIDDKKKPRLAIMWINFGHYHQARIRALTPFFEVTAIEFARSQALYRWAFDRQILNCKIETIAEDDWEKVNQLSVAKQVWRRLEALRPDILLIPGYANLPCLAAASWAKLHGRTSILMTESTEQDRTRRPLLERLKSTTIRGLFDKAIGGGNRSLEYLQKLGYSSRRTGRFYDVVDNQYYADAVAALPKASPASFPFDYFLFVGRLAPEKNLLSFLKAFANYCSRGGTWDLIVVGDGPLRDQIQTFVTEQRIGSRLRLEGKKTTTELAPYYAYARALVHPSISEPWGLVVNEAMASGLPVIVSRTCGCAPDLVQVGVNGFLVDPLDVEQMTSTLLDMSALPESERTKMGNASKTRISRFSPESWSFEVRRLASE